MLELTSSELRTKRAEAHHLSPVVSISQNGASDSVIKEIDRSLTAHGLIKVKLYGVERAEREAALSKICSSLKCAPVQHIGNILVLWRPKPAVAVKTPARRKPKPKTKKQAAAAAERRAKS